MGPNSRLDRSVKAQDFKNSAPPRSLAGLWCDQGKRAEIRDVLAPVYGWFTEGLDTPVLKEAKALLDELAS